MSFIHFGREICNHIQSAENREWWLSNGLGGYAGGNISGTLNSLYHGLLFVPNQTDFETYLLMVKAEIKVKIGEKSWFLYSNKWQDEVVAPKGFQYIESFHLEGLVPVWTFLVGGYRLEMRLWMEQDENATWIAINCKNPPSAKIDLQINFIMNQRPQNSPSEVEHFEPKLIRKQRHLKIQYNKKDFLHIQISRGKVEYNATWVKNFYLAPDLMDNHLKVGHAITHLNEKETWFAMRFATEMIDNVSPGESISKIRKQEKSLIQRAKNTHKQAMTPWLEQLILTAHRFFIQSPLYFKGQDEQVEMIVTGYPHPQVKTRETLLSLSGLTLATGQIKKTKQILEILAHFVNGGLLPDQLPQKQGQKLDYYSVDNPLWYILAWFYYIEESKDIEALERVLPVLESIISSYHQGTYHHIKMAEDYLIQIEQGEQTLTWMNTLPRFGKPVEINALWYNALQIMAGFLGKFDKDQMAYLLLAEKVKKSFKAYLKEDGNLYDVLENPEEGEQVRGNQILAISLPWSLLEKEQAIILLENSRKNLYTSYGLKSLAAQDKNYQGQNSQPHQGGAWTWLLCQYCLAEYKLTQDGKQAFEHLTPLLSQLQYAGLGTISEFFDGDLPYIPRGTASSATAVASILDTIWRIHR